MYQMGRESQPGHFTEIPLDQVIEGSNFFGKPTFAATSQPGQDVPSEDLSDADDLAFELRQKDIAEERATSLQQIHRTTEACLEEEADRWLERAGFGDLVNKPKKIKTKGY